MHYLHAGPRVICAPNRTDGPSRNLRRVHLPDDKKRRGNRGQHLQGQDSYEERPNSALAHTTMNHVDDLIHYALACSDDDRGRTNAPCGAQGVGQGLPRLLPGELQRRRPRLREGLWTRGLLRTGSCGVRETPWGRLWVSYESLRDGVIYKLSHCSWQCGACIRFFIFASIDLGMVDN